MRKRSACFSARGYVTLPGLLSESELSALRAECDDLSSSCPDLAAEQCVLEVLDGFPTAASVARSEPAAYLAHRAAARRSRPADADQIARLLFSKMPAAAASAFADEGGGVRDPVYLFNEHYVVKPARVGGPFRWHTDAAHQLEALLSLAPPTAPNADQTGYDYASFWCALDDIDGTNGSLVLLPRDAPQPPNQLWHEPASEPCERWLARDGSQHAVRPMLRAGDAVFFSSQLWHCSEPNTSARSRRAFYAQYSRQPVGGPGHAPLAFAVRTTPNPDLIWHEGRPLRRSKRKR